MKKMTNIEMLAWGIEHIAKNHGFESCTDEYEYDGQMCIYGGCNVPTLSDVRMLCEEVGISKDCVESSDCGIDIYITEEWMETMANKPYVKGNELWRRIA